MIWWLENSGESACFCCLERESETFIATLHVAPKEPYRRTYHMCNEWSVLPMLPSNAFLGPERENTTHNASA